MSSLSSYLPSRTEALKGFYEAAQMVVSVGVGYGIGSLSVSQLNKDNFRALTELCLKYLSTAIEASLLGLVITGALHIAWPNSALSKTALGVSCAVLGGVLGAGSVIGKGREDVTFLELNKKDLLSANLKLVPKSVHMLCFEGQLLNSHRFNDNLTQIPPHVRKVEFVLISVKDIQLDKLPKSIETLNFTLITRTEFAGIQLEKLGPHIKEIGFTNCDLGGVDLMKLPETVQRVRFKVKVVNVGEIPARIEVINTTGE